MDAEGLSRLSTDMLVRYVQVLITLPTQMQGSWLTGWGAKDDLREDTEEAAGKLCTHIPCSGTGAAAGAG